MSSEYTFEDYRHLLDELDRRYTLAREGEVFDFDQDIKPFLDKNKKLAYNIENFNTDHRLTEKVKNTMFEELMELLMSCHISRFSLKLYHEKYKYINMWINHAHKEGLI